jgi:hypothetical protein
LLFPFVSAKSVLDGKPWPSIWNRFSHSPGVGPVSLELLRHLLQRGPQGADLQIKMTTYRAGALKDIIIPYAHRIGESLDLTMEDQALAIFFCLPAGSFPVLRSTTRHMETSRLPRRRHWSHSDLSTGSTSDEFCD